MIQSNTDNSDNKRKEEEDLWEKAQEEKRKDIEIKRKTMKITINHTALEGLTAYLDEVGDTNESDE